MKFDAVTKELRDMGFLRIAHIVAIHHLRKDFVDYHWSRDAFYIKPVGKDFLHVAVIEYLSESNKTEVQVRYTQAGDDLLYGLAIKFREGNPGSTAQTFAELENLITKEQLVDSNQYVRKRFKHGRTKAKTRALFLMVKDVWIKTWSFRKG